MELKKGVVVGGVDVVDGEIMYKCEMEDGEVVVFGLKVDEYGRRIEVVRSDSEGRCVGFFGYLEIGEGCRECEKNLVDVKREEEMIEEYIKDMEEWGNDIDEEVM
jgi:hypothetical protein